MDVVLLAAFIAAAVMCAALTVFCVSRRSVTPTAGALAMTLGGCAAWSAADAISMLGFSNTGQLWAVKSSYLGIYLTVLGLYRVCETVVNPHFRRPRFVTVLLVVVPVTFLSLIMALPVPGPFLASIHFGSDLGPPRTTFGPLFWAHTAVCYVALGLAFVRLVRARVRAAAVFRGQLDSLLLGSLAPTVGNLITLIDPGAFGHRDLTPLLFTCTAVTWSWALLRQGLLRIIPVAREQVLVSISDGVFVIDALERVVDVNPAGRELIRRLHPDLPEDIVGIDAARLADQLVDGARTLPPARTVELLPGFHTDLHTTNLGDRSGRPLGRVIVCHDITELVRARTELQQQLDVIERLRTELVEQTLRDPLTGLHNRRYLDEALRIALADADRSGKPVALLMVDIDHFKSINDRFGHQVGDSALVSVAHALAAGVRPLDTVARFGGEEFVVVLLGASRVDAMRRAEQLRTRCTSAVIAPADDDTPPDPLAFVTMTASIGLAMYPQDAKTADSLLAAADHALYSAKSSGRNRVVDAGAVPSTTPTELHLTS